jgi:drug/metabolite transporter (DMT)-like permease
VALAVTFALLAALFNTLIVMSQHLANTRAAEHLRGHALTMHLAKNPLWLFGMVCLLGSFLCQAVALHNGPLSLVQPILVVELILALLLRRFWLHQSISSMGWVAAVVTGGALSVFLLVGRPTGGVTQPSAGSWIWTLGGFGGLTLLLYLLGRTGTAVRRAAFLGAATAFEWALVASFIKATTNDLTSRGVGGTLEHFPVYLLALTGALGFLLEQKTLRSGPISVSQPLLVILDPIVSICLGITLFSERFPDEPVRLVAVALSLLVLCVGALILTRATPAHMEPVGSSQSNGA